ncbi:TPA: ead/Ea22-like family protein [Citrobacter freundii]|uniref:ead/Ea22-like family protein n=1 Tax=Citrobacter freundii TaxID=546 RepID=UPI0029DC778E|nr:ead/Ea22-like family protein [Citrobacter freundii]MDX6983696.1 ead/Ea22-like family protein [Citrobacter freundii]
MTALNKQALREAANAANIASWGQWESYKSHKGARGYEVKVGAKAVAQHCLKVDSAFIAAANPPTVLALLDENLQLQRDKDSLEAVAIAMRDDMRDAREKLEAAEKRIAEHNFENRLLANADRDIKALRQRIAELEAREVELPKLKILSDYLAEVTQREREDILVGVKLEFHRMLTAAGIGMKGE